MCRDTCNPHVRFEKWKINIKKRTKTRERERESDGRVLSRHRRQREWEVKEKRSGWFRSFIFFILLLQKLPLFFFSSTRFSNPQKSQKYIKNKHSLAHSLTDWLMASLQSPVVSPIPQLVNATRPNSLNKNLLFVDFVGLYCKSKRTRRRIGLSSSFSRFSIKKNSCPVHAILSVDRQNISPQYPPPPDLKPQVFFFFRFNLFCCLHWNTVFLSVFLKRRVRFGFVDILIFFMIISFLIYLMNFRLFL